MSIIIEYTPEIKLYNYTEKSILLVTPPDWGRSNAEILKTFSKFGSKFTIGGETVHGWIMAKRFQTESMKKIQGLLTNARGETKKIEEEEDDEDSFVFDEEDEEKPRPSLLRPKNLNIDIDRYMKLVNTFKDCGSISLINESKTEKYNTKYFFSGSKADVDNEVKKVMDRYPAHGYGTFIEFSAEWGPTKVSVVNRANSCD
jgi:hypothetical protein